MNSLKILHTCLNVTDLERSIVFYRDRLGLKLTRRFEVKENNAEIAFLEDAAENAIELTHWRDKKQLTEGDNFDHIALGVRDLKATVEQLRQQGTEIAMEPFTLKGGTHQIAFIRDPDGNWLELIEEECVSSNVGHHCLSREASRRVRAVFGSTYVSLSVLYDRKAT